MTGNVILFLLAAGPMAAAILSWLIGRVSKTARNFFADGVVILEFLAMVLLLVKGLSGGEELFAEQSFLLEDFCGRGLSLKLDGFRVLYGLVAALMWMMTTIFSREYFAHYRNRNRYYLFLLMTLGATMGVFLSADLFTTFIFFEIMSFTSYVWVVHEEKPGAMRAAATYLGVAVIGGMVMLMGLFLLYDTVGTLDLEELYPAVKAVWETRKTTLYLAGGLMVFGFGAKAGMFPLHIWLPKAHPVAPAPASALLSGILTKSGIFGILAVTANIFLHDGPWGMAILLLGTVTMFGGALLAVFSVDMKRTLACSSMSQIGFILVGVGMQCLLGEENALAVRGTFLHMLNHSLIKLDLFMVAGVVYMNLHKLDFNEIRGFGRKKPLLMFAYLMGALGIGGIPLWNGYISKTLLHESIVEYAELLLEAGEHGTVLLGTYPLMKTIEWVFLISGGMTVAYMLKLFVCVFLEKNADKERQKNFDEKKHYWNNESRFAILGSALILPVLGFFPYQTMNPLADLAQEFMKGEAPLHAVHYFNFENLKGGLISITIGILLYFGVIRTLLMRKTEDGRREYINGWPKWLDLENLLYRPLILVVFPWLMGGICAFFDRYIIDIPMKVFMAISAVVTRAFDHLVDGFVLLARKTSHKQIMTVDNSVMEDRLAYSLGAFLDKGQALMNRTFWKKKPRNGSHIPRMVELEEATMRTGRIIEGSLSFGLMMSSIGLLIVLVYLLWF